MSIEPFDRLWKFWEKEMQAIKKRPEFAFLNETKVPLESYKWYLRETYHHTKENPISQLIALRSFDRSNHELMTKYILHARSEITHDQLALNDYCVLGGNREVATSSQPLPDTEAMIGYTYYCAYSDTPLKYLGYLFHVEALPATQGQDYIGLLIKMGVPETAVTFLKEHSEVDPAHQQLMRYYLGQVIKTEHDYAIVEQAIRTGMLLHNRMIRGAIEKGITG